jgi:hypothetical protein
MEKRTPNTRKPGKRELSSLHCDWSFGRRQKRKVDCGILITPDKNENETKISSPLSPTLCIYNDINDSFHVEEDDNYSLSDEFEYDDSDMSESDIGSDVEESNNRFTESKVDFGSNHIVPETLLNKLVCRIQCEGCLEVGHCQILKGQPIGITYSFFKYQCQKCGYKSEDLLHKDESDCVVDTTFIKHNDGNKVEDYSINIFFFLSILLIGCGGSEAMYLASFLGLPNYKSAAHTFHKIEKRFFFQRLISLRDAATSTAMSEEVKFVENSLVGEINSDMNKDIDKNSIIPDLSDSLEQRAKCVGIYVTFDMG